MLTVIRKLNVRNQLAVKSVGNHIITQTAATVQNAAVTANSQILRITPNYVRIMKPTQMYAHYT